jgi:hypothetical protein
MSLVLLWFRVVEELKRRGTQPTDAFNNLFNSVLLSNETGVT